MAEFTPSIVPLGGLVDAAAAASELAQQVSAASGIDDGTLIGDTSEPTWP